MKIDYENITEEELLETKEKLSGWDWVYLLIVRPQFHVHCPWEKLNGKDWVFLLIGQPQFSIHCPWKKLDGNEWACLLMRQPQFFQFCDLSRFSKKEVKEILKAVKENC